MAVSKEDILDSISNMTVMEVVDLISEMEEKFGVTAAAAVAAAADLAAAADAHAGAGGHAYGATAECPLRRAAAERFRSRQWRRERRHPRRRRSRGRRGAPAATRRAGSWRAARSGWAG